MKIGTKGEAVVLTITQYQWDATSIRLGAFYALYRRGDGELTSYDYVRVGVGIALSVTDDVLTLRTFDEDLAVSAQDIAKRKFQIRRVYVSPGFNNEAR